MSTDRNSYVRVDQQTVVMAVRYALTRSTTASSEAAATVRDVWDELAEGNRDIIVLDIRHHLRLTEILGTEADRQVWEDLLAWAQEDQP